MINCDKKFAYKGSLKSHQKSFHSIEIKQFPHTCEHKGCLLRFKTKKLKLSHHFEKLPQCLDEIKSLHELIVNYQSLLEKIINQFNINNFPLNEKIILISDQKYLYKEL